MLLSISSIHSSANIYHTFSLVGVFHMDLTYDLAVVNTLLIHLTADAILVHSMIYWPQSSHADFDFHSHTDDHKASVRVWRPALPSLLSSGPAERVMITLEWGYATEYISMLIAQMWGESMSWAVPLSCLPHCRIQETCGSSQTFAH